MASLNLQIAFFGLILTVCGRFCFQLYRHRSWIRSLHRQGIPMPEEWSWLMGHFLLVIKSAKQFPSDANINLTMKLLGDRFPEEVFLLDMWPFAPSMLVMLNPEGATQVSTKFNLPKNKMINDMVLPITGGTNLLSMNGDEWKTWRNLFNPGFSLANLTEHIPRIVDSVEVFCGRLAEYAANQQVVCLDEMTMRLTFDVIIKVSLDVDIDHQRKEHAVGHAFETITKWHSFWDPRILLNPLRPLVQGYYGRIINSWTRKQLQNRFLELQDEATNPTAHSLKRPKSILGLALQSYVQDDVITKKKGGSMDKLDEHFARVAARQIRLFLFAGNDSTSSTIVFAFYFLHKHPPMLTKMREEHDAVFGTDPAKAAERLRSDPALLNQCHYTIAVLKETLRIYPPADGMRQGQPGVNVVGPNGQVYPTENLAMVMLHIGVQYNPRIWPRPLEFIPERWLAAPGDELYPASGGAWRPFEVGPRACIGQTLSLIELRTVMVLTARTFEITPAYEDWDKIRAQKRGVLEKATRWVGIVRDGIDTVNGNRVFQTERAGTHPSHGYPCRVSQWEKH